FAHENKILVLCYPSHTTHIYQGLDVIIFVVLKWKLSQEPDEFAWTHAGDIKKENFLEIYGRAHITTLSADNVKAAFQKTGVLPFNPSIVTSVMLAPSKPKSMQSNLLAEPPTPLRTIVKMFQNLSIEDDVAALASMNENDECPPSPSEAQKNCQKEIIEEAGM
ncbi:hypothetical protein BDQ17DRAFT_1267255, partial [Cyathus striatus]